MSDPTICALFVSILPTNVDWFRMFVSLRPSVSVQCTIIQHTVPMAGLHVSREKREPDVFLILCLYQFAFRTKFQLFLCYSIALPFFFFLPCIFGICTLDSEIHGWAHGSFGSRLIEEVVALTSSLVYWCDAACIINNWYVTLACLWVKSTFFPFHFGCVCFFLYFIFLPLWNKVMAELVWYFCAQYYTKYREYWILFFAPNSS